MSPRGLEVSESGRIGTGEEQSRDGKTGAWRHVSVVLRSSMSGAIPIIAAHETVKAAERNQRRRLKDDIDCFLGFFNIASFLV
ncbi:MAG: hypothetical protein LBC78_00210 [Oscillospiraceae bacterium]|nr:hypothetical protein [Oscillospiraceae bacterium]